MIYAVLFEAGLAEVQKLYLKIYCYEVGMLFIGLTSFSSPTIFYVRHTVDLDFVAILRYT